MKARINKKLCAGMQVTSLHHLPQKKVSQTSRTIRKEARATKKLKETDWVGTHQIRFQFFFFFLRQKRGLQLRHCRLHRRMEMERGGKKTHTTTCTSKQEPNKSHKSSDRSSLERQRRTKPDKLEG